MAYIYVIKNDINNKVYIGKTNFSIEKRFKEHLKDCTKTRKEKRPLYNAIDKYGEKHFWIELIEECSAEEASDKEKYWIKYFNSYEAGYNATLGGDGKAYLNYKKILSLYDNTLKSQKEIANECSCSIDSVQNIVNQYRENVDWEGRFSKRHIPNSLGIAGKPVRCIENNMCFESATKAARWLVENNYIKSVNYGRNKIPIVCRKEENRKTVGGFHWEYADN